jgi:membrane protease YdiL (CAAX protease family)
MTLDLLAFAFLAVVLAPVFEELLFRGLLLGGLMRSLPLWAALCTSAGVFALVHPSSAIIPVFILGLFAGLAYRWSGWLLAAIIAHAVYNGGIVASTIASQSP